MRRSDLIAVAALTVTALGGCLMLLGMGRPVPDQLWTLATLGFGALAGGTMPLVRPPAAGSRGNDDPDPGGDPDGATAWVKPGHRRGRAS